MSWFRRDPEDMRHRETMAEARRTTRWTRRAALITAFGVAIAALSLTAARSNRSPGHDRPKGMLVVVRTDDITGVGIVPVAGGLDPVEYLRDGTVLYVDCLELVEPKYVQAHISDGAFASRWIDALSLKTPRNEDVRFLKPPLPFCGPPVPLATSPTS